MYFDFTVPIPSEKGKIYRISKTKNEKTTVYIDFVTQRAYDPDKGYTASKRSTIGKQCDDNKERMWPNQNFYKFFPDADIPEEKETSARSSVLHIGPYIVIRKIMDMYKIPKMLEQCFPSEKDRGLFMDLVAYSIVTEGNAAQHYPAYAYTHPLFTPGMHIYSDSKISDFLSSISSDQSSCFLNAWNAKCDHREKIYFSYDSTNKNCQAGDIDIVEYGKPKVDTGDPIFNYSVAYDTHNQKPLFYECYPGSINDVSQLEYMIGKAVGFGYKKIGFILDRGYFSRDNLQCMDDNGYSFVIMLKGRKDFVKSIIKEYQGSFEKKREYAIPEHDVYGITIKRKLYQSDNKERYIHIYHSISRESHEWTAVERKIELLKKYLDSHMNEKREFNKEIKKYFDLVYDKKTGVFLMGTEKKEAIEEAISYCGYFVLITSEKMSAEEAIMLYKSRDTSEKLFCADKTFLGNHCVRVHSTESAEAKVFIEFVALIVRSRIYTLLMEQKKKMVKKRNYMTVPAVMEELEKIDLSKQADQIYRLDHAVTATQKVILEAFGMDTDYIKTEARRISDMLTRKERQD